MSKPNFIDRHVGGRVRSRRIEARLSEAEFAAALGVSMQQLNDFEEGRERILAQKTSNAGRRQALEAALKQIEGELTQLN